MMRFVIFAAFLAWLGLFVIGGLWAGGPVAWAYPRISQRVGFREVEHEFPLRLARPPGHGKSTFFSSRAADEEDQSPAEAGDFDAWDWAFRETRNRFVLFFVLWMGTGLFLRWFVGRFQSGERQFEDYS
jgi:hypothetical protein